MKRWPMLVAAACLLALWHTVGRTQSRAQSQPHEETLGKKLPAPLDLKRGTTDEHLLALARAADVNFIADATSFSQTPSEIPHNPKNRLWDLILDTAYQRNLTWLGFDRNTFLFWPDQNFAPLGRQIAAQGIVRIDGPVPTVAEMAGLLTDYLRREHGWDGKATDFTFKSKIRDLPPEVRERVIAGAQASLFRMDQPEIMANREFWFANEFWQKATLQLVEEPAEEAGKPAKWRLWVAAETPVAWTARSLSIVKR